MCLHYFSFTFIDIQEVILSQITLQSCTLKIKLTDFSLSFVKLTFPGINISKEYVSISKNVSIKPFVYAFSQISILAGYVEIHNTMNGIALPAFPAMMNISDCTLQGTPMHVLPWKPATKGIQWLNIKQVVMNTYQYYSYPMTLLDVSYVEEVGFTDVTFQNIFFPLISLGHITYVEFSGYFVVSHNSGEWGVDIYNCESVHFSPDTHVMFYYNTFRLSSIIFHFNHAIQWIGTAVHIKNNAIEFDSHLEIYGPTSVEIIRSNFIFENNRGLRTLNKGNNAIMKINNCNILAAGVVIVKESTLTFFNNIAQLSGGLTLVQSILFVDKFKASFGYNQGGDGGAIAFYEQAQIFFNTWCFLCILTFHQNVAEQRGGAIFVEDSDYIGGVLKTLEAVPLIITNTIVQLYFSNNSAGLAGNELYGGWMELMYPERYFNLIFKLPKHDGYTVASNPIRICKCTNSVPTCEITVYKVNCYPGQTFEIEAVAVGQKMGIVPSTVMAQLADEGGSLGYEQNVQSVGKSCTALQYRVHSEKKQESLNLTVEQHGVPSLNKLSLRMPLNPATLLIFRQFSIVVTLFNCPEGFEFNTTSK